MVKLTPEEEAEFTAINCAAFDLARKEALKEGVEIPVWLSTSEEAKERYRENIREWLKKQMPFADASHLDKVFTQNVPRDLIEKWKAAELEFKRLRVEEEGNLKAHFC